MGDLIDKLWKPGERKKIAYRDLKSSLEMINEEFRLLENLSGLISKKRRGNPEIERALRDSFLIHFRRIHNFLYSEKPDKGPILAEDFFVKGEEWRSRRNKESKIIRDMSDICDRVIPGLAYGDDALINGITKNDFKMATEEINKPFQQFVGIISGEEVEEISDEETSEPEQSIDSGEKVDDSWKVFGGHVDMYKTKVKENGILEVQVGHQNKKVRKMIEDHMDDPGYFYERLESYVEHQQAAKKWLAEVIQEYPGYFKDGRVEFVMK
jgi:hypothetical protein